MAESEGRFSKARLEAFSDGVIAVIITIMVLDLKAPESRRTRRALQAVAFLRDLSRQLRLRRDLLDQSPQPLAAARRVTARLVWANDALLFCLSLIPSRPPMSGIRTWRRSRPWSTARCSSPARWLSPVVSPSPRNGGTT